MYREYERLGEKIKRLSSELRSMISMKIAQGEMKGEYEGLELALKCLDLIEDSADQLKKVDDLLEEQKQMKRTLELINEKIDLALKK